MSSIARRYGISLVDDRAVTSFDTVGFSLLSPLGQMAQLNSLSCSINTAYSLLSGINLNIDFARTTTGGDFYVWNRARGISANVELYHLMLMILTNNAIEHEQSKPSARPQGLHTHRFAL